MVRVLQVAYYKGNIMEIKLAKLYQGWSKDKKIFVIMPVGALGQTVAGWDEAEFQEVRFNEYPQFTFILKNEFLNTLDN